MPSTDLRNEWPGHSLRTHNDLAMLVGINQGLNEMMIVLGQHVVALAEGEGAHDIVGQVGKPPGHVFVLATKTLRILESVTKQPDFVQDDGFVRADRRFTHGVRDDPAFAGMDDLVGRAGQILFITNPKLVCISKIFVRTNFIGY